MELRPHQAVMWDLLQQQRHVRVSWGRREGATSFGWYALAAFAAWEPGTFAWVGLHHTLARETLNTLRVLLPEFRVDFNRWRLWLASAHTSLSNGSEITIYRSEDDFLRAHRRGMRRLTGMVVDGVMLRPSDYADGWSVEIE